jgi:hypothetical protein
MTVPSFANAAALAHVTAAAGARRAQASHRLRDVPDIPYLTEVVREHGRVTLNFHPDRVASDGRTVAEALAADGIYRGQYETGISNGGRTAFPGGDRDQWELNLFGGAYHQGDVPAADRPKYGALNLAGHADGGAPRFGSCHVRLRPHVNTRCTFTFHDSHLDPVDVGTMAAFDCVLAGLFEEAAGTEQVLGVAGADPAGMLRHLPGQSFDPAALGRSLDDYIEAQVHGVVDLATDAEAIVADPSFRGTRTHEMLEQVVRTCGIALDWHAGFQMLPAEVDEEFRGPQMPSFAKRVCAEYAGPAGTFDAEVIGRAAQSVAREPRRWAEWGTRDETLQLVKYMWHTLVVFGVGSAR